MRLIIYYNNSYLVLINICTSHYFSAFSFLIDFTKKCKMTELFNLSDTRRLVYDSKHELNCKAHVPNNAILKYEPVQNPKVNRQIIKTSHMFKDTFVVHKTIIW